MMRTPAPASGPGAPAGATVGGRTDSVGAAPEVAHCAPAAMAPLSPSGSTLPAWPVAVAQRTLSLGWEAGAAARGWPGLGPTRSSSGSAAIRRTWRQPRQHVRQANRDGFARSAALWARDRFKDDARPAQRQEQLPALGRKDPPAHRCTRSTARRFGSTPGAPGRLAGGTAPSDRCPRIAAPLDLTGLRT